MTTGGPWPLSVVTGFLGSGKTTLITGLLRLPDMADTVVIVNEFGEIGLDHHLISQVSDRMILLPNGCICCTIRHDVVQTLRELHQSWLAGAIPDFGRVLVETTGLAEPSGLLASLLGHPLLADVFNLTSVVTVVDAEHGARHLADHRTCWLQVRVADRLLISKCDLAPEAKIAALQQCLIEANPLASVRRLPGHVSPDLFFERTAERPARSGFACEPEPHHLADIGTIVLLSDGPLSWRRFQIWLNDLLERFGPVILRLKGSLCFDGSSTKFIVQAVHDSFYPIVEAPSHMAQVADFLVLITDGQLPADLSKNFAACKYNIDV